MKRAISVAIIAACFLTISAVAQTQSCSTWTNYDLRGTYTMTGSGYIDLSKALSGIPGLPPMPSGLIPMSWAGITTFDGAGNGSGWIVFNAGGTQMSASFVNKKYSLQPDCSISVTYSAKINELNGLTVGPFAHLMVAVVKPAGTSMAQALELHMISMGTAPGAPTAPVVDTGVAYRISMQ